jgi:hypothetical protein
MGGRSIPPAFNTNLFEIRPMNQKNIIPNILLIVTEIDKESKQKKTKKRPPKRIGRPKRQKAWKSGIFSMN